MDDALRIGVMGIAGRMGRMLDAAIAANPATHLAAAAERAGHAWVGRDLGEVEGAAPRGVTVTSDPLEVFASCQAVMDFTSPEMTVENAALAAQARAVHIIGTTGLTSDQIEALAPATRHAVQIRAGNMSLGVNLLTRLTEQVAKALGPDFDIEIVEMHHRHKVDAPSGTALMLGEAAAKGRDVSLDDVADRARDGQTGARREGDIGFTALRGGDVAGEHDVIFAADGERIVLRHIATDRMIFARGAVRAALWGHGRKPGAYDMLDVLGMREDGR